MNPTRDALHRVATHVLARARHAATGKFGLRATPGGFGTPAFGPDVEVLRVDAGELVRERGGRAAVTPMSGQTLAELAAFAGVDLTAAFSAGLETRPIGDVNEPLAVGPRAALALGEWYGLGWRIIDSVVASLPATAAPSVIQLWPEHFDAGCDVAAGPAEGQRCNLGASPGDSFHEEPYLYVGPWTTDRPGDPAGWNAPFGAFLAEAALRAEPDPVAAGVAFCCERLARFRV